MDKHQLLLYIGAILFAYLYGSIPFSLLLAKSKGIDLRTFGSGNLGGSNLGRACGTKYFIIAFVLDMSKGAICVWISNYLGLNPLIVFPFAVLGHAFSIYIKFKGGKGIATCFGFALAYSFWPAIIAIISFLIFLKIWKYVSLAAILAIYVFVIVMLLEKNYIMAIFVFFINLGVIYLHRANLKRIKDGTERKISWM